jgi:hypothetical protein
VSVALHRVNWGRVSARKRDVTGNRNEMTTRGATGASADVAFTVFNNAVSIDVIIFPKPSVHPYGVRANGYMVDVSRQRSRNNGFSSEVLRLFSLRFN